MSHVHEKIDFTVEVFIVHKNKVLLRKHDKYGIWLSIGGHIELHEDPVQAALREVKEEVGLTITLVGNPVPTQDGDGTYEELLPPKYLNRHRINEHHEHVCLVYFGTADSDEVIPENAHDEWYWFSKEDLAKNEQGLKTDILFYANSALVELGRE